MVSLENTVDNSTLPTDSQNLITYIEPRYMSMMKCVNDCMFCENPKGPTYAHHISVYEKIGYLSCGNCIEKAKSHVTNWLDTKAFGGANRLRGKNIKVKRSSGEIESDWRLDENQPSVYNNWTGQAYVHCVNYTLQLEKGCTVDELLELNPLNDPDE